MPSVIVVEYSDVTLQLNFDLQFVVIFLQEGIFFV